MSQIEKSTFVEGPVQNMQAKKWPACPTTDLKERNIQVGMCMSVYAHTVMHIPHTKENKNTDTEQFTSQFISISFSYKLVTMRVI